MLLTGALHEDGFADVCDGFGGGRTSERVLDIMRNSRLGAFGVIGLIMLVGLKWQAMAALPPALLPAAVIAAHALSRGAALAITAILPYARKDARPAARMSAMPRLRLASGCRHGAGAASPAAGIVSGLSAAPPPSRRRDFCVLWF